MEKNVEAPDTIREIITLQESHLHMSKGIETGAGESEPCNSVFPAVPLAKTERVSEWTGEEWHPCRLKCMCH